ncbi:MAG: class I SAM-dependent methyltransferase [Methylococcales bacterium]
MQLTDKAQSENFFSGILGEDYNMLQLICPLATEMSRLVGIALGEYSGSAQPLTVVEIGGGTGITTLAMLTARDKLNITSIDSSDIMQNQAKKHLQKWLQQGLIQFCLDDALSALQKMPDNSADIVASAYTLHNFEHSYREQVVSEIYRILKSGGQFINGDRYGLDDISAHTRCIQQEVSGYFNVLINAQRLDLLEQWIVHLFNDESENHVMRESVALAQLRKAGFSEIILKHRQEVNALLIAVKA